MAKYVGLWNGGASYGAGEWALDAEAFTSLDHAEAVLRQRYLNGHTWSGDTPHVIDWTEDPDDGAVRAVVGVKGDNLTCPAVSEGSSIILARMPAELSALEIDGVYAASYILEIGPRGGVKRTRL